MSTRNTVVFTIWSTRTPCSASSRSRLAKIWRSCAVESVDESVRRRSRSDPRCRPTRPAGTAVSTAVRTCRASWSLEPTLRPYRGVDVALAGAARSSVRLRVAAASRPRSRTRTTPRSPPLRPAHDAAERCRRARRCWHSAAWPRRAAARARPSSEGVSAGPEQPLQALFPRDVAFLGRRRAVPAAVHAGRRRGHPVRDHRRSGRRSRSASTASRWATRSRSSRTPTACPGPTCRCTTTFPRAGAVRRRRPPTATG